MNEIGGGTVPVQPKSPLHNIKYLRSMRGLSLIGGVSGQWVKPLESVHVFISFS